MHIVVCVKQVANPDIASSLFRVDEVAKKIVPLPGLSMVVNPFDEQAVEAALRIRETSGEEVSITALTIGETSSVKVIKHVLALGADQGILLNDTIFEGANSYGIAKGLSAAIRELGNVDLVLTGRQAVDTDAGVVGQGVAELLNIPAITLAKAITIKEGEISVNRVISDGEETLAAPLPVVVTIAHEYGEVRKPSLRETMRASKKPLHRWSCSDLKLEADELNAMRSRNVTVSLYQPERETKCEWLTSEDLGEVAKVLLTLLRERKLI